MVFIRIFALLLTSPIPINPAQYASLGGLMGNAYRETYCRCMIDDRKWIELKMHKTDKGVLIPLHTIFDGKAQIIIDSKKNITTGKYLKVGLNSDANRIIKQVCKKAGITNKVVTFHTARHSFASLLLLDGVPVTTVQKMLGHSSVKTTQIYAKVTIDTIEKDISKTYKST